MGLISALIGLLGLAALVAGAILWLPFPAFRLRRSLATKLLIGGGVAFLVGGFLSPAVPVAPAPAPTLSPSPAPTRATAVRPQPSTAPTPAPATPAVIAPPVAAPSGAPRPSIRNAGWYPPILNIDIDFGQARSGAVLEAAGDAVLSIGRQMNAGHPPVSGRIGAINFVVLGRAGADAAVGRKIVRFTIDADAVRQLAKSGASASQLLDAARDAGSWTPANDDVIDDYCRSATAFCQRVK